MNYKTILKNRSTRYKVLAKLNWVPDSIMLRLQYRLKMGSWPNFRNPLRFTEKIQLYKMYYHNPIMSLCVDKYEVRHYVEQKGLGDILNKCFGVYQNADDIDWDSLPNTFVMKKTTGGGGLNVAIVRDKSTHNMDFLRKQARWWTRPRSNNKSGGREWAYEGLSNNRVVFEKLLVDDNSVESSLVDFKFFCFNGIPHCIQVDSDRQNNHHQNYYDIDWNPLGVYCSYEQGELVRKPDNFEQMLEVARTLSEDFPFVRVDLYNVNGVIVFGELTFYPSSGYGRFHPDSFDFELGKAFDHRSFIER